MEIFEKSGEFIKKFAKALFVFLAVVYFIYFIYLLSEDMAGEAFIMLIFGGLSTVLLCFSLYITGDNYELNKKVVELLEKNSDQNLLIARTLQAISEEKNNNNQE